MLKLPNLTDKESKTTSKTTTSNTPEDHTNKVLSEDSKSTDILLHDEYTMTHFYIIE